MATAMVPSHRLADGADDSAHGRTSEPLLAHHLGAKGEESASKGFFLNRIDRIRDHFAAKEATPELWLFLALVFGISSGLVAFVYDQYFEALLKLFWEVTPGSDADIAPLLGPLDYIMA